MSQFSRRTIVAAIDVLDSMTQAETSRFLLRAGPEINDAVRKGASVPNRMNDLMEFVDDHPSHCTDEGPLETVIVKEAVALLPPDTDDTLCSESIQLQDKINSFRYVLRQDGFVIADGSLRPALPVGMDVPNTESELTRLLEIHEFLTAKGHFEQALDAHERGNWASANAQIRTFFDALLDAIAEKLDPEVRDIDSGQPRRAKLARLKFLKISLGEWDNKGRGFINGLVKRLNPEGAHPGLSSQDDSTFRLHIVLLTAVLLLRRYDRRLTE